MKHKSTKYKDDATPRAYVLEFKPEELAAIFTVMGNISDKDLVENVHGIDRDSLLNMVSEMGDIGNIDYEDGWRDIVRSNTRQWVTTEQALEINRTVKHDVLQAVLACPMEPNDSGDTTVGGYLRALLTTLWREEEGFTGKRPFGNSGWQNDVYVALVKGGLVDGVVDSDGYLDDLDDAAEDLILRAIASLS